MKAVKEAQKYSDTSKVVIKERLAELEHELERVMNALKKYETIKLILL